MLPERRPKPPRKDPAPRPDWVDAEWREVEDPPQTIPCPWGGKPAAPIFGTCYHCFRPLRVTWWELAKQFWRAVGRESNLW